MHLTMVGTGYVGLVTGTCLANAGLDVTCLDIDEHKIDRLNRGEVPIYEPGLEELIRRNTRARRLHFTTDAQQAYQSASIIFVCVGTPSDENGCADLRAVLAVARDIAEAMEAAPGPMGGEIDEDEPKIIVVKSTVPVGTHQQVRAEVEKYTSKPFRLASNPEFLKEGAAISDFNKPDRVVVGVEDKRTGERLRELYEPFVRQGNPVFVMDLPSAEMVKYASNTMLATKISFINEISALCAAYGADIEEVRRGMCADSRIGNQFFYPGLGYGGSCFPKDVLACIGMGDQRESPAHLLQAVYRVNKQQRQRFTDMIDTHFGEGLSGKTIAVWGLAFKPGTDDMREAPSVDIVTHLLANGARVVAYDPVATETARAVLGDEPTYVDDAMHALSGADALVICTEWTEFRQPDFDQMRTLMASPVIFDGRNLYWRQTMQKAGFVYHSIGRRPISPEPAESEVVDD